MNETPRPKYLKTRKMVQLQFIFTIKPIMDGVIISQILSFCDFPRALKNEIRWKIYRYCPTQQTLSEFHIVCRYRLYWCRLKTKNPTPISIIQILFL